MATVTDSGEVTIDDQFVGRLEGFRFRLDPSANADELPTLRAAGIAALGPVLSLRADKFYNAPDPEIDVTEQGGLMWGEHAVGKLVPGSDVLSPQVQPFVDEDAAPDVGEKIRRRLGHWLDRRIAALFAPLVALRDDEALQGIARGIAFRLVEALGVLPRSEIAGDVKTLDQEGRASLRKHGVRFGQYTVFMPLMLKPAPTRLRLVLWSLKEGFQVFPETPPPGLVTMPALGDAPPGYYSRAGYRLAGERAIRIDMLERLADLIRPLDARSGFEATPEMLSITGLSLDQFARLLQGLGYEAASGTRARRKPEPAVKPAAAPEAPDDPAVAAAAGDPWMPAPDAPQPEIPVPGPDLPPSPPLETPMPEVPDVPFPGEPTEVPDGPDEVPDAPVEVPPEERPDDIPAPDPLNPPTADAPETPALAQADAGPDAGAGADADAEDIARFPEADAEPPVPAPAADMGAGPQDGVADPDSTAEAEPAAAANAAEQEHFFVFTRAPRRRPERPARESRGPRPRRDARPRDAQAPAPPEGRAPAAAVPSAREDGGRPRRGKPDQDGARDATPGRPDGGRFRAEGGKHKPGGKGKPRRDDDRARPEAERVPGARPPRADKPIDPDNPFAALLALKLKG